MDMDTENLLHNHKHQK